MNRRNALKTGALATAGAAALTLTAGTSRAAGSDRPAFVLVHGAWHGAWTWNDMTVRLAQAGHAAIAVDLPGAGTRTKFPKSFLKRPLDKKAFATEPSPVAGITQAERNTHVMDAVKNAATLGNGKVVLVGHSWGGNTISHVTEAMPDRVHAVVYLTAFMLPSGMPPGAMLQHKTFAGSKVNPLLVADPAKVGALRMDTRSSDPAYVAAAKEAFYADVSDDHFAAIANLLHCDEVASTAGVKSPVTKDKFGKVSRHFIRCADDQAIQAQAQDHMVAAMDGSGIGGRTEVHRMSGSHSPFLAQPDALLEVFRKIAA